MIKKWLLKQFGISDELERNRIYISALESDVAEYRSENYRLEAELLGAQSVTARAVKVMQSGVGDVAPTDEKARREYVASASNFYVGILEKKLMQMIAQIREMEDTLFGVDIPAGLDRNQYDMVLKGTSNAFKLLMDWGEQMRGEHQSNIIPVSNND